MYNHNKAQQSKKRVHISWDILYTVQAYFLGPLRRNIWGSSYLGDGYVVTSHVIMWDVITYLCLRCLLLAIKCRYTTSFSRKMSLSAFNLSDNWFTARPLATTVVSPPRKWAPRLDISTPQWASVRFFRKVTAPCCALYNWTTSN